MAAGWIARHTHKEGVELKRGAIFDRYGTNSRGAITVASAHDPALGRHTVRADLVAPNDPRGSMSAHLVDVELVWMAAERFALSGFSERAASGERPARLLRNGWLCEYEVVDDGSDGPVRGARPVR